MALNALRTLGALHLLALDTLLMTLDALRAFGALLLLI